MSAELLPEHPTSNPGLELVEDLQPELTADESLAARMSARSIALYAEHKRLTVSGLESEAGLIEKGQRFNKISLDSDLEPNKRQIQLDELRSIILAWGRSAEGTRNRYLANLRMGHDDLILNGNAYFAEAAQHGMGVEKRPRLVPGNIIDISTST